jgi:metal-dependent amidase/aminoacylase/carboxypeptidase family protein
LNQVIVKERAFTPAARSMVIALKGKTSHAAEPENGINPGAPTADIIKALLDIATPDVTAEDFFLVTTIFVELGERAYGTSAGEAEMGFTFRSWSNKVMKLQSQKATELVMQICDHYGIQCDISWTQEFFSNQNDPTAVDFIRQAAGELKYDIHEKKEPFKWGEDFGLFTKKFRGAMFGLGAGENTPALHNPDYDFPDSLIESGSKMFYHIIHQIDQQ